MAFPAFDTLIAARPAPRPEAYRAYLLARHHFNKFTVGDIKGSISYYERAISLDPLYAPAYTGLAAGQ